MKILKITIEIESDIEAYQIVSGLGFEHRVVEADLDGHVEQFGPENKPAYFLRDNTKNSLPMIDKSDIEAIEQNKIIN